MSFKLINTGQMYTLNWKHDLESDLGELRVRDLQAVSRIAIIVDISAISFKNLYSYQLCYITLVS